MRVILIYAITTALWRLGLSNPRDYCTASWITVEFYGEYEIFWLMGVVANQLVTGGRPLQLSCASYCSAPVSSGVAVHKFSSGKSVDPLRTERDC